MAPLQFSTMKCPPCDTGVCTGPSGFQYLDNDGHFNDICGRPEERHGYQGSFTHGVTIFKGGVPRNIPPAAENDSHGKVLYISSSLKPDNSVLPSFKPGTTERFSFTSRFPVSRKVYREADIPEANNATVLAHFPQLKADMSYSGFTNVVGGRPTERRGLQGGFTRGVRIFRGGEPRDIQPFKHYSEATVLYECETLKPELSSLPQLKPGTSDERQGRCGSFEHGDLHIHMPTKAEAELWKEAGQKGGRRYGCGHYLAGTSILRGSVCIY